MKKFIIPEVSSVELEKEDVMAESNLPVASGSKFTLLKDAGATSEEYKFWKNR